MKKVLFRDLYLIGISFIAGVLFIIQCGGSTQSVAQAVMDAVGIDYSNNESGLQATNMQAAVDEVVASVRKALSYVPLVYDNNGNVIGELIQLYDKGATIWDANLKASIFLDMLTGEFVIPNYFDGGFYSHEYVFFDETACAGIPYLYLHAPDNDGVSRFRSLVSKIGEKYYAPNFEEGKYIRGLDSFKSSSYALGPCQGGEATLVLPFLKGVKNGKEVANTFIEAKEIPEPNYPGPLHIGGPGK